MSHASKVTYIDRPGTSRRLFTDIAREGSSKKSFNISTRQTINVDNYNLNMASNVTKESASLGILNGDFLKCPVCQEEYTAPKMLPCLHNFCFECLNKSLKQSKIGKGQAFLCPICQHECVVPTRGVPGMKTNIFLISLQEFHHRKSLDQDQVCDACDSGKAAKKMCVECSDWMCSHCCNMHQKVKVTKDHTLVTPDELHSGEYDELIKNSFEPLMCNKHDEPLRLFCSSPSCMAPICTVCKTTLGHDGHAAIDLDEQAEVESSHIREFLPNTQRSIVACQNKIHNLKHEEKITNYVRKKIHKQINSRLEEVVEAVVKQINDYGEDLHSQVESMVKEHKKEIRGQLDGSQKQLQQMITAKTFAESLLEFNRPEELVAMSREVSDRLQDFQKIPNTTPPGWRQPRLHPSKLVTADQITNMFGNLVFEGEVVRTVLLRSFSAKLMDDAKDCALCDISIDVDGNIIVVDRDNRKVKVFDSNGNLQLSTGVWILKNPNRVTALKHTGRILVKDDKSLRIINPHGTFEHHTFADLKQPVGITQTDEGEVLITDWMDSSVHVYNEKGNVTHAFRIACEAPGYICSSPSGNIIISDWKQHCVKIFNRKGELLHNYGRHGSGDAELDHPYGVCCDKYGHIIVADTWNNRIHMVSEEGKYLSILLSKADGIMWPQSVVIDKRGNLIVLEQHGNIKLFQYMA